MSSAALAAGLHQLRRQLAASERHEDSDEQLLSAFTSRRDNDAFAILVHRHGPMVLQVCRRLLGHEQDAEDAFQAAFVVLARKAASLRNKGSLASFLHGIAYRLAREAKRSAVRRRKHEGQVPSRPITDPADELSWREVRELLDEEIAHLTEIYRSVFILCCLENLSRAEVAQRLGLKECTVLSRLAKARKRLAQRLARRGVELTAVLTATGLAAQPASVLPAGLIAATVKATSEGLSGIVSAAAAELVQNAAPVALASKAKIAVVLLLTASLLAGASVWAYCGLVVNVLTPSTEPAEQPASKADDKLKATSPQREAAKGMEVQGRVLAPEDKPKAGAKILLLTHGANRKVTQLGISAADGRFTVVVPQVAEDEVLPALIAQADGAGIAYFGLYQWKPGKLEKPVELGLVKDRPIHGRIISTEGKPVVGARITVENLGTCANNSMDSVLAVLKKRPYNLYGLPRGITLMAPSMSFLRQGDTVFAAMTDAEGRFVLRGLGAERFVTLHLSGRGIATEELWIVNRDGFDPQPYNEAMLDSIPKGMGHPMFRTRLQGPSFSFIAETEKVIRGLVKNASSGKGLPNVLVYLTHTVLTLQTTTNAEGRYEIHGAHKAKSYTLQVDEDPTVGYVPCRIMAGDTVGYQPLTADINVKKGVIITGKMIDGATGKPLPGFVRAAIPAAYPFVKDFPTFNFTPGRRIPTHSGGNGAFRMVAIPGPVLLMGQANEEFKFKQIKNDPQYPQFFRKDLNPGLTGYFNADGSIVPLLRNFCKVLQIKPDAKMVEQDIVLEPASVLPVQIHDADGNPLRGVWVAGSRPQGGWYPAMQCENAECPVYQLEPDKPRLLVFFHPARKLAGTLALKGDEKAPVRAKLDRVGEIKGRLLAQDGKPLAGMVVEVQYRQPIASAVYNGVYRAKQVVADTNGMFTLDDLIPQQEFGLSFHDDKQKWERSEKPGEAVAPLKPGECRDLGALKLKPKRPPQMFGE